MDKITQYLNDFNEVADNWFAKATFVAENYQFFKQFFEKENREKAQWEDFQSMGMRAVVNYQCCWASNREQSKMECFNASLF